MLSCFILPPIIPNTIKNLNIIVGLFLSYNVSIWLLRNHICKVPTFLAASSFFIYVSHWLICDKVLKVVYVVLQPVTDLGMLSVYMLALVVTLVSLFLVFCLMRHYTPFLLKVITGRI